jgi:predicted enzyme related to lactoylglutathione lyase
MMREREPTMLAKALAMATIPAEDLARAISFYEDKLGLRLEETPQEGVAIFRAGAGSKVLIYQRGRTKAEHTSITFSVDDVDAAVDGLIERGVTFEQYDFGDLETDARGVADVGGVKLAWLQDSEGNILGLAPA